MVLMMRSVMRRRPITYLALGVLAVATAGVLVSRPFSAGETTVSALARETHFHGIAVDSGHAERLYLATHHGLFVVGPDGRAERISENRDDFMGFSTHPSDPNLLYASGHPAGGGNLGFVGSTDGGRTWQTVGEGAYGPSDFHQMTISPIDPSIIFGIYGTDLQASRDGGQTWKVVSQIPDRIFSLAASAQNRNGLYAASAGGLLYSNDGGQSWIQLTTTEKPATMVATAAGLRVFVFIVGEGLLQASEPELDWQPVSSGFGTAVVLHFAAAPRDTRRLYVVTLDPQTRSQAILVSRDGGANWSRLGAR